MSARGGSVFYEGQGLSHNILLLTATIAPPANALDLARTDVALRHADYARAFQRHLDMLERGVIDAVVFAENSDSDLSSLQSAAVQRGLGERVEFISFSGLDYPSEFGRAYGEVRIINHVMEHSRLVAMATDPQSIIWKVTGRYWVRNFEALVRLRPVPVDFYCNMRDFPRSWCDMYLLAWTRHGYDVCLRDAADAIRAGQPEIPHGVSPEELLRDWLEQRRSKIALVSRFNRTPLLDGIRGYDNQSYAKAHRWKNLARRVALRVAPRLWI